MEKLTIKKFRIAEENYQASLLKQKIINQKEYEIREKSKDVKNFVNAINNIHSRAEYSVLHQILIKGGLVNISNDYFRRLRGECKFYGECSPNHEHINIYTREEFILNDMEDDTYSWWADDKEEIYDELQPYIDNANEFRERFKC